MFTTSVNLVAVLVVTLISMAIGWLWYSPVLFGKAWMSALGKAEADKDAMKKSAPYALTSELVATFVKMYVLAKLIAFAMVDAGSQAALIALWLWLGFVVTTNLSVVTFEGRSKTAYLISMASQAVIMVVAAVVLAMWQ
jgi:hypothetical protein